MNRIVRSTYVLEVLGIVGVVTVIGAHAMLWLMGEVNPNNLETMKMLIEYQFDPTALALDHLATMPVSHRLLGLLVDSGMFCIAAGGAITFVQMMRRIRSGEFFSPRIIGLLKRLSMLALAWAIFNPVRYMLLSVITSWHLGTGNRVLALAIGSNDIMNVVIFASFVLITALIQEGYALQQERDLTI